MDEYIKHREKEKNLLNSAIDEIVRELTEEHISQLPELTDMAEKQEKYKPDEYTISLTIEKLHEHRRFTNAEVKATIQKIKSDKSYENFKEYWGFTKQKITDDKIQIGLKALYTTEIFRNLAEYYGNDLQNPEIKQTGKALQEIVTRLIKFGTKHDEENIISLDTEQITIKPDKLKSAETIHLQNLYDKILLNKKVIGTIVKHDVSGKFKQKIPLEITANVRVWYD